MLLKHIFLLSIKQVIRIPIVIELRNINEFEGKFVEFVFEKLVGTQITKNIEVFKRVLKEGGFIFLLDGYDEIFSDKKSKLTSELVNFIDAYNKNYFIITSRPGANVESIPRFNAYLVNELNKIEILQFVKLQLDQVNDEDLTNKILSVIKKPENKDYNSYLSSPLLLSMFILTFNSYPELPKSKSKFYWNVFETLCIKHDNFTKYGGYQHERKSGLQNEEFEDVLKWFSFVSYFKGKYSFDSKYFLEMLRTIKSKLNLDCSTEYLFEDLTVAISIIVQDGLKYKFPHRSLQEYFTALLIKEQNDDVKKIIYQNKTKDLELLTNDSKWNFWNLCKEIDTFSFIKHFELFYLEKFISQMDSTSEYSKCNSFLKWSNFKQGIAMDMKSRLFLGGGSYKNGVEQKVMSYLKIVDVARLSVFNQDDWGSKTAYMIKEEGFLIRNKDVPANFEHYFFNFLTDWDEKKFFYLKELGLAKKIIKCIENAEKLKVVLEKNVSDYESNNSDLLNL